MGHRNTQLSHHFGPDWYISTIVASSMKYLTSSDFFRFTTNYQTDSLRMWSTASRLPAGSISPLSSPTPVLSQPHVSSNILNKIWELFIISCNQNFVEAFAVGFFLAFWHLSAYFIFRFSLCLCSKTLTSSSILLLYLLFFHLAPATLHTAPPYFPSLCFPPTSCPLPSTSPCQWLYWL